MAAYSKLSKTYNKHTHRNKYDVLAARQADSLFNQANNIHVLQMAKVSGAGSRASPANGAKL